MPYLQSNQIKVFPATRRSVQSAGARQVTEANLVGMINKLIDKDGFVITKLVGGESSNTNFSFCIHGYFFTASLASLTAIAEAESKHDVYAKITLDVANEQPEFYELAEGDVIVAGSGVQEYHGITFSGTEFTGLSSNEYSLHILTYGTNWIVPESSQIKFNLNSIQKLELIDGGVI